MINFADVKARVTVEQVAAWLGIEVKGTGNAQLRGQCPICQEGGERAFVITPAKQLWKTFCTDCDCGGDCIELVARVHGVSQKDAANKIAEHFLRPKPQGEPISRRQENGPTPDFDPNAYADGLDYEHADVLALGITADIARELQIGYSKKGIHRGRVVIPLRFDDGSVAGFIGFSEKMAPVLKFPKL